MRSIAFASLVAVAAVVGACSAVEAAPQDQDNGKAPAEAACLARLAKKLKFPASGTTSHVQYPFMIVSRVNRSIAF